MYKNTETEILKAVEFTGLKNLAVKVGLGANVLFEKYYSSEFSGEKFNETTLFDMASVTKAAATTLIALYALDTGKIQLTDPLSKYFVCGNDKKNITVQNLLTHTFGYGYKSLVRQGITYENVAQEILEIPLDIPAGRNVLYSCPAFILLGKILEKVFEDRLDRLFDRLIAAPLSLENTCFLPKIRLKSTKNIVNSNLEEEKRGVVNDYNAQFLGGVAGNAGLFSNMRDMTKLVRFLQNKGKGLIGEATFVAAIKNYTEGMNESRALGFLYVDEKYDQLGGLFKTGAIGHCGHTGQSFFLDPVTDFYTIILSDATVGTERKYGREAYQKVCDMRADIHAAIKRDFAADI